MQTAQEGLEVFQASRRPGDSHPRDNRRARDQGLVGPLAERQPTGVESCHLEDKSTPTVSTAPVLSNCHTYDIIEIIDVVSRVA